MNRTATQPAVERKAFPTSRCDWFWSVSEAADSASLAWVVRFESNEPGFYDKNYVACVRCVHE